MKSFQLVGVLGVASSLFLSACSGGGSGLVTGGRELCAKSSPISPGRALSKTEAELSLDPADKQIPPGIYKYNGATIYYVDAQTGVIAQMSDVKQVSDGTFKASVDCNRGAFPGMTGVNVQAQGVSEMRVETDGKMLVQNYEFNFKIEDSKFIPEFKKSGDPVSGAPKDIFDDPKNPSHGQPLRFVKTSKDAPLDFEIRTSGTTARGSYDLVIHLQRTDLPPPTFEPGDTGPQ